jgi:ADP-heptose:LPS heptosyltransferase
MKVVVFKFNNLGDNVVFVPVVQALRRHCPDWEVTLLTTPASAELYAGPLGPQRILTATKRGFDRSYRRPWELLRWAWRIRRLKPDACLVAFDQGSAAHLVARLSGARVRVGGNLENIKVRGSLTDVVPMPEDAATWNCRTALALANVLGRAGPWEADPPAPDLDHLVAGALPERDHRRRVLIHSGANRIMNQWTEENFAAVARDLARDHDVVWISHGRPEGSAPAGARAVSVSSLADFSRWLKTADLFLGNNSGPMHVANAVGCAGVVINGPSGFGWDPHWQRERWQVLRHPNLPCQPCEEPSLEVKACANLAEPMACLRYWTPARVAAACRLRLASTPRAA